MDRYKMNRFIDIKIDIKWLGYIETLIARYKKNDRFCVDIFSWVYSFILFFYFDSAMIQIFSSVHICLHYYSCVPGQILIYNGMHKWLAKTALSALMNLSLFN